MSVVFGSSMAGDMRAFLEFKHSLGYRYARVHYVLRSLDRFLIEAAKAPRVLRFDQTLLGWLARRAEHRKPISLLYDVSVARQFCSYLRRRYPRRIIREPLWPRLPTTSGFVPSILSLAQVRLLLRLARRLARPTFRRALYRMLILMLYCTGLRLGEALRLRLKDVDARAGALFIAESKGRSRWVPFHRSLSREIERYLTSRGAFASSNPDARFFVVSNRHSLPGSTASDNIKKLLRKAGLKPLSGRTGPRTHDIRHTFAVHRLTRWYRSGVEMQTRLPWLSAYMGHTNMLGTETYLTATPEAARSRWSSLPTPVPWLPEVLVKRRSKEVLLALVQSYFQDHLRRVRGASRHTIRAFQDGLRLFFAFLAERAGRTLDRLGLDDIRAEEVLAFLDHLESVRGNSAITRNCLSLAKIRS